MWVGSDTKIASGSAQDAGHRIQRIEGVPATILHQDRRIGDTEGQGVLAARGGFGRAVPLGLAAGHHEVLGLAVQEELDGVIQARRKHGRRPPVELGCAQDHDRPGRPLLVAGALLPDPVRRIQRDEPEREKSRQA